MLEKFHLRPMGGDQGILVEGSQRVSCYFDEKTRLDGEIVEKNHGGDVLICGRDDQARLEGLFWKWASTKEKDWYNHDLLKQVLPNLKIWILLFTLSLFNNKLNKVGKKSMFMLHGILE